MKQEVLTWVLYVNGSSNKQGSGAGIILTTPEGIQLEYALRFRIPASNNEAEYEALLVGLQLAISIGAKKVQICSNSQLIVNQLLQQYEARKENIVPDLALVREVANKLKGLSITQIPRE